MAVFLDWIGSLRIRHRSKHRVELCLSRSTSIAGWVLVAAGGATAAIAWPISIALAAIPALVAAGGLLLGTLRRTLVFDRDDGLLRVEQTILGISGSHRRCRVLNTRGLPGGLPRNEPDRWDCRRSWHP
jgi:hypothetical protein